MPATVTAPTSRTWLREGLRRWALRMALAAPLWLVAVVAHHNGYRSGAAADLSRRADAFAAGGGELAGIDEAVPFLPTLLAAVLPGGVLGVALVAALVAATALHLLIERLVRRDLPVVVIAAMTTSVIAVPAVWFQVVYDIAGLLSMAFVILAIDGFVRFVVREDTLAGFRTGTSLALAYLCDPGAIVHAVVLVGIAPLVLHELRRARVPVFVATGAVLLFPITAAALSLAYLDWRFGSDVFLWTALSDGFDAFAALDGGALGDSLLEVGAVLARSPLYVAVGLLLAKRTAVGGLAFFAPVVSAVVVSALGVGWSAGLLFATFGLLALMTAPRRAGRRVQTMLVAAAAVQFAVAVLWVPAGTELAAVL